MEAQNVPVKNPRNPSSSVRKKNLEREAPDSRVTSQQVAFRSPEIPVLTASTLEGR